MYKSCGEIKRDNVIKKERYLENILYVFYSKLETITLAPFAPDLNFKKLCSRMP